MRLEPLAKTNDDQYFLVSCKNKEEIKLFVGLMLRKEGLELGNKKMMKDIVKEAGGKLP